MNGPTLSGYQVTLLPVQLSHIEQLRHWRNSEPVRRQMLCDDIISKAQQEKWFANLQQKASEQHFVVQYKDKLIGACNIKSRPNNADIEESLVYEMGLYIGEPAFAGNIIAFAPTLVLNDYCFNTLKADHLYALVKPSNYGALRYNEKLGYKTKVSGELIELTLHKEDYDRSSVALKQLLSRPSKQRVKNGQ